MRLLFCFLVMFAMGLVSGTCLICSASKKIKDFPGLSSTPPTSVPARPPPPLPVDPSLAMGGLSITRPLMPGCYLCDPLSKNPLFSQKINILKCNHSHWNQMVKIDQPLISGEVLTAPDTQKWQLDWISGSWSERERSVQSQSWNLMRCPETWWGALYLVNPSTIWRHWSTYERAWS